jgi:nicotinamide riboside kinase
VITIVVSGPESTGKTSISEFLTEKLGCLLIPEFARDYIIRLNRKYNYTDIELIAREQVKQRKELNGKSEKMVICDTWLIITKIWFLEVFGRYPVWIDDALAELPVDLYLLCKPDIPWIPDPVRENGGRKRDYLFEKYRDEIIKIGASFEIISGKGQLRFENALKKVKLYFPDYEYE